MSAQKIITSRAWAEMLLLSLVWGGSFLSFSVALRELGVFTTVAFRVAVGAIALWLYVLWRGYALPCAPKTWAAFFVMGLLNNIIPFSLIAWGQLRVPSGLASILNASTAIFGVVVAAAIFSDERLTMRKSLGVLLGFLGVSAAIGLSSFREFNLTSLAQLAILAAALTYAFAGAWARTMFRDLSPQVTATGTTISAALIVIPLALIIEGTPTFAYAPETWAAIIYLSLLATTLAYLLYYRVLNTAGSGNLLLVTLLVVPFAIVLGAVVLGEELRPRAYIGFALLAAGMVVLDGRIFGRRK